MTEPRVDELLRSKDIEAEYRIPDTALRKWRQRGGGPAWFRLAPHVVVYRRSAVEQWIKDCESADSRTPQAAS